MERDDALIMDILVAARKVLKFTRDCTFEEFAANDELQSAVLWQIGIMGEAARKVSESFKELHSTIPFYEVAGMRNRLVHDYSRIDLSQVWDTIQDNIPHLLKQLEPLAKE